MFQIIVEGQDIKRKMARGTEMREIDVLTHGVETDTQHSRTALSTATVIELRLTRDDLAMVDEGRGVDRDVVFLRENTDNDPNGFVVYKGTPQLTQTALYVDPLLFVTSGASVKFCHLPLLPLTNATLPTAALAKTILCGPNGTSGCGSI